MASKRNSFPERNPKERALDFKEVTLPFSLDLAQKEAARCLQCKHAPCISGCPVNIQIPAFIQALKEGNPEKAYEIIRKDHFLPSVCGRVCPQEKQCEKLCVLAKAEEPVAIGKLERFSGDTALKHRWNQGKPANPVHKKAAVAGSGPASLACAGELARNGVEVTVFEALHTIGGVLIYGIPEFRLPKAVIAQEIQVLKDMGVKLETDVVVGKTLPLKNLLEEYDAVFLGVGAGFPVFLDIPGEKLPGVFSANEFLTRINLMNAYRFPEFDTPVLTSKKTLVVGGGNTAMDAARTALRLGCPEVRVVYRRGEQELPARKEEVIHAKEEGVSFDFLLNPVEIFADAQGRACRVKCEKMVLGEPDEKGKRKPLPSGQFVEMEADTVIIAVGTRSNPLISASHGDLKTNSRGYLEVDENLKTSIDRVYAGGDIVTGAATVIEALGAGKKAAKSILARIL